MPSLNLRITFLLAGSLAVCLNLNAQSLPRGRKQYKIPRNKMLRLGRRKPTWDRRLC